MDDEDRDADVLELVTGWLASVGQEPQEAQSVGHGLRVAQFRPGVLELDQLPQAGGDFRVSFSG